MLSKIDVLSISKMSCTADIRKVVEYYMSYHRRYVIDI